jgi:peptide/nickel transport system ATP-binding protein
MPSNSACTGEVIFQGRDLLRLGSKEREEIWGKQIAMVFQDPGRSLNPVVRIERQMTEGMRRHLGVSRSEAHSRALALLKEVGVPDPERRLRNYPHELSGGMRQRVMIAMAVACQPKLLVADEPTTALDVTIQAGILDVLRHLRDTIGTAILLITHDLGVVADVADRVVVMYAGRVIEESDVDSLFARPSHPYTRGLLDAVPNPARREEGGLREIPGRVPTVRSTSDRCTFYERCTLATELCNTRRPALEIGPAGHLVRCWHPLPAGGVA